MIDKLIAIALISILTLFVGPHQGLCQDDDFGVVFWSADRNLDWDDFQGQQLMDSIDDFYLDLYVDQFDVNRGYFYGGDPMNKLAYVYKKSSYISEKIKNDNLLRYLNVYFDMAAYYSYKFIKQTSEARHSKDQIISDNSQVIGNAVIEEWKLESTRLSIETNYGEYIEILLDWEAKINELVATIVTPKIAPFEPSFGFDLAVGKLKGLGSYNDLLTEPIVGLLSCEVLTNPFVFSFGLSGGGQEVKKSFTKGNDSFLVDSEPNIMNIFIHSGYMLLDTKRFRIIPRVGIHFSNLRYPMDDELESSVWAVSYTAGATLDINLWRWDTVDYFGTTQSNLSLRCGAYYYPVNVGKYDISHTLLTVGMLWTFSYGSYKF